MHTERIARGIEKHHCPCQNGAAIAFRASDILVGTRSVEVSYRDKIVNIDGNISDYYLYDERIASYATNEDELTIYPFTNKSIVAIQRMNRILAKIRPEYKLTRNNDGYILMKGNEVVVNYNDISETYLVPAV